MGFEYAYFVMMVFFKQLPKEGNPLAMKGLAEGLRKIERALQRMEVHNGKIEWNDGIPKIIVNSAGGGGTAALGKIKVGGVNMTIPAYPETEATDKWCIRVPFDGSALSWVDWDMTDPDPADARMIDPDASCGDQHIDRAP